MKCKCGCGLEVEKNHWGRRRKFFNESHRNYYYNRRNNYTIEETLFGLPIRNDVMSQECADKKWYRW